MIMQTLNEKKNDFLTPFFFGCPYDDDDVDECRLNDIIITIMMMIKTRKITNFNLNDTN